MPLQPSSIYFCPGQMSQSAFFFLCSYILIGNRVRVIISGMAPEVTNARPPGGAKQMPHPRDWQGRQMPRSSPVGGGGAAGQSWNWLSITFTPYIIYYWPWSWGCFRFAVNSVLCWGFQDVDKGCLWESKGTQHTLCLRLAQILPAEFRRK